MQRTNHMTPGGVTEIPPGEWAALVLNHRGHSHRNEKSNRINFDVISWFCRTKFCSAKQLFFVRYFLISNQLTTVISCNWNTDTICFECSTRFAFLAGIFYALVKPFFQMEAVAQSSSGRTKFLSLFFGSISDCRPNGTSNPVIYGWLKAFLFDSNLLQWSMKYRWYHRVSHFNAYANRVFIWCIAEHREIS